MSHNFAMFVDSTGNMVGNAERDGSRYYRGTLNGERFQCPADLLKDYIGTKSAGKARIVYVDEPIWQFGAVIC